MVPEFKQEREPNIEVTVETLVPEFLQDAHATLSKGYKEESISDPIPKMNVKSVLKTIQHTYYM
jgi:hypothetical protein